jgi:hypothetical protein
MNKYAAVRRSHVLLALHRVDCELEHAKSGGKRHSELTRERSELQSALQERNAELLNRWEKGVLYGHYTPSELARFEQLDQYDKQPAADKKRKRKLSTHRRVNSRRVNIRHRRV